jgi:hypothetical protein
MIGKLDQSDFVRSYKKTIRNANEEHGRPRQSKRNHIEREIVDLASSANNTPNKKIDQSMTSSRSFREGYMNTHRRNKNQIFDNSEESVHKANIKYIRDQNKDNAEDSGSEEAYEASLPNSDMGASPHDSPQTSVISKAELRKLVKKGEK